MSEKLVCFSDVVKGAGIVTRRFCAAVLAGEFLAGDLLAALQKAALLRVTFVGKGLTSRPTSTTGNPGCGRRSAQTAPPGHSPSRRQPGSPAWISMATKLPL